MKRHCRVSDFFTSPAAEPRDVIEIENVWVSIDGRTVLEGITFKVKERSFVGIIGPNGAGKTTLLRVILGLINPDRGTVTVMGMTPQELKHELHHIGYMPQQVLFDPRFPVSVFDVVMMGRTCCIGPLRFANKTDREAARESIDMVGLSGLEDRPIGELSGGQQKRAFLARALCLETRILVLDEPTAGLDIEAQEVFMDLLSRLKTELGLSVLFVSHDVNILARFADELVCINRTMHMRGTPEEVLGGGHLEEAYRCEFDFLAELGGSEKKKPGDSRC